MTLSGLLLRFAGIYTLLMITLTIAVSLMGLTSSSGINIGALMGGVLGACQWFSSKNRRSLEPAEKKRAVLGMWAIDLGIQLFMIVAISVVLNQSLSVGSTMFAIGFVGLLHLLAIYFMVNVAGKQYANQQAKVAKSSI